jgi:hypothetical protein
MEANSVLLDDYFKTLNSAGSKNLKNTESCVEELKAFVLNGITRKNWVNQIDNAIAKLTKKAKYELNGTGEYALVKGHHPLAKVAFEGDAAYNLNKAFSVSIEQLGGQAIHRRITGNQNNLYSAWRKANPKVKLTVDEMAEIEIKAMSNAGIPEDIATGWVIKALEDIKLQGVTGIRNIPWNGVN